MSIPEDDFYVPTEEELLRKDIQALTMAINRLADSMSVRLPDPPAIPDPPSGEIRKPCLRALEETGLSSRAINCLADKRIHTVRDLFTATAYDLSHIGRLGPKTLNEIYAYLKLQGVSPYDKPADPCTGRTCEACGLSHRP